MAIFQPLAKDSLSSATVKQQKLSKLSRSGHQPHSSLSHHCFPLIDWNVIRERYFKETEDKPASVETRSKLD
jgi:hypothetical protein